MHKKPVNTVTGIILYKNEKEFIKRAVDHIYPHVDQLILCDDMSTDKSYDIVSDVLDLERKILRMRIPATFSNTAGFGDKKNFPMVWAKHQWILYLDADEVIEHEFWKNLPELISDPSLEAVALPRRNYIDGVLNRDAYPDHQFRLFRSYCRYIFSVHEELVGYNSQRGLHLSEEGYHIIHRKSSKRQAKQDKLYKSISKVKSQFLRPDGLTEVD